MYEENTFELYAYLFLGWALSNRLKIINTSDELAAALAATLAAALAADAYAHVKEFGAICITYCVGGLKVVNATAQTYTLKNSRN